MATYGSFPGVRINTQAGGITSIAIGEEEKLVIFGEANYDASNDVAGDDASLSIDAATPEQISSNNNANAKFGTGSELAEAMILARTNGANVDFLYGVAVPREDVVDEAISGASGDSGTLSNVELVEDPSSFEVKDSGGSTLDVDIEFRYEDAPASDGGYAAAPDDTLFVNPLNGAYQVTDGAMATTAATVSYTYSDYNAALTAEEVRRVVNETETGIYAVLSDSTSVATSLQAEVSARRDDFQLVNGLCGAEPNSSQVFEDNEVRGGADARYDTGAYSKDAALTDESMYLFAPARQEDTDVTVIGAIGGLFAGNPIDDPIYNDALSGVSALEQTFTKSDADNMRGQNVIPLREAGLIRVVGNRSAAFGESGAVAPDFFTRRITDRVIIIAKQVGDRIIGRINDQDTRDAAQRLIFAELRELARDGLIRNNAGDTTNFSVEVTEDATNSNEVDIDISFTPFGIVKRVDETITVDTS
jgi:hypothetical protein